MTQQPPRTSELKNAILSLCKIFKYSGVFEKLNPEDIRLAKFDKPKSVPVLAELLHRLLSISDWTQISSRMTSLRYPRSQLLTSDDGSPESSRELLFAITWYMRVTGCIDEICAEGCEPVDIQTLLEKQQSSRGPGVRDGAAPDSLGERVSRLTSSICKLSLLKKQFVAASIGIEVTSMKLTADVDSVIKDCPLLLKVYQSPSIAKQYERLVERKINLLKACSEWRQLQSIFWVWMNSVLAPTEDIHRSRDVSENLQTEITENPLQTLLERKVYALKMKLYKSLMANAEARSGSTPRPEEMTRLLQEAASQQARLVLDRGHRPRLRERRSIPGVVNEAALPSIENDIEILKTVNARNRKWLENEKRKLQKKIEAVSAQFNDAILVRPTKQKRISNR